MKIDHESFATRAAFATHKRTRNVIYLLVCQPNGKGYVGQTRQILWKRWREHRNAALCAPGQTYKQHTALAKAMRRYGPAAFDLTVLEVCTDCTQLDEAEARWIAQLGTLSPGGYNLAAGGKSAPRAAEVGAAIANSNRGRRKTPEWRAALSAARLGQKLTDKQRRQISEFMTTRPHTAESRAKRSAALKGRINGPRSAETRAKISTALTGRSLSEATKAKLAIITRGKKRSAETRRRMSKAALAREVRKRSARP